LTARRFASATALGCLLAYAAIAFPNSSFCIFKELLGFPCPGCGGIRALEALSRASILDSIRWNPGVWVAAIAYVLNSYRTVFRGDACAAPQHAAWSVFLIVGLARIILVAVDPQAEWIHLQF
jgi:hypothetical protein